MRLLTLETRRNIGLLFFPLLVGAAGWVAREGLPAGIALWGQASAAIRFTIITLGPLIAGLAAWMAGRSTRRGMEDLLATTPRPATGREVATWAGTMAWGILAYVVVAAYVGVLTYREATWGGPLAWPILEGLVAVAAYSAIGYAAGCYLRNRLLIPLVPIALYILQDILVTVNSESSLRYLSPASPGFSEVFYAFEPGLGAPKTLWLLGLTGVALTAVALRGRRTVATWGLLLAAMAMTTTAGATLLRADYGEDQVKVAVPYQLVCVKRDFEVCVHPAYEAMLPQSVALIDTLMRPLKGIPGVPTRMEQRRSLEEPMPTGTVDFQLHQESIRYDPEQKDLALRVALGLVTDQSVPGEQADGYGCGGNQDECAEYYRSPAEAQNIIGDWLARQAGIQLAEQEGGDPYGMGLSGRLFFPESKAALERFAALTTVQQRAWLEAYYADLRAGKLTLEDLP